MKIKITFKDPDAVSDALDDAFRALPHPDGLSKAEWASVKDERRKNVSLLPFIEWHEYCTVEIDTEAGTGRIVPVGEK